MAACEKYDLSPTIDDEKKEVLAAFFRPGEDY